MSDIRIDLLERHKKAIEPEEMLQKYLDTFGLNPVGAGVEGPITDKMNTETHQPVNPVSEETSFEEPIDEEPIHTFADDFNETDLTGDVFEGLEAEIAQETEIQEPAMEQQDLGGLEAEQVMEAQEPVPDEALDTGETPEPAMEQQDLGGLEAELAMETQEPTEEVDQQEEKATLMIDADQLNEEIQKQTAAEEEPEQAKEKKGRPKRKRKKRKKPQRNPNKT